MSSCDPRSQSRCEQNGERPAHLVSSTVYFVVLSLFCIDSSRTLSSCGGNDIIDGNFAKTFGVSLSCCGNDGNFAKNFEGSDMHVVCLSLV